MDRQTTLQDVQQWIFTRPQRPLAGPGEIRIHVRFDCTVQPHSVHAVTADRSFPALDLNLENRPDRLSATWRRKTTFSWLISGELMPQIGARYP